MNNPTNNKNTFIIESCTLKPLTPTHVSSINQLYSRCPGYFEMVDGGEARTYTEEEIFEDVPPGKTPKDKLLLGLFDVEDELVGIVDMVKGYPCEDSWFIGLLLLDPRLRGRGMGEKIINRLKDWLKSMDVRKVGIGVVEENKRALVFWKKMGFVETGKKIMENSVKPVAIIKMEFCF